MRMEEGVGSGHVQPGYDGIVEVCDGEEGKEE